MVYILIVWVQFCVSFFVGLWSQEYWRYKKLSTMVGNTCSHKDVSAFQFSVQGCPMMQTKGTHSWLWYPFDTPQLFRVYSCPWAGPVLLSALPCCCSLPWQQQLLALGSVQKTSHIPRGERNTGMGVRRGMEFVGRMPWILLDRTRWFSSASFLLPAYVANLKVMNTMMAIWKRSTD